MAFALIKYLEGSDTGKLTKVEIEKISPKIHNLKFEPTKKYKLDKIKIRIFYAAETIDKLNELIQKKSRRNVPEKMLETATSEVSDDEPSAKRQKITRVRDNSDTTLKETKSKKQNLIKSLASRLNMKVDTVQSIIENKPVNNNNFTEVNSEEELPSEILRPEESNFAEEKDLNSSFRINSKSESSKVKESNVLKNSKKDKRANDKDFANLDVLQNKVNALEETVRRGQSKIDKLKSKILELTEENKEITKLNLKLQQSVIDRFDELEGEIFSCTKRKNLLG